LLNPRDQHAALLLLPECADLPCRLHSVLDLLTVVGAVLGVLLFVVLLLALRSYLANRGPQTSRSRDGRR